MMAFTYNSLPGPSRVVFGSGSLSQLAWEIKNIGCSRALILTTPGQTRHGEAVKSIIGDLAVGLYNDATAHTPTGVTEDAAELVKDLAVDCLVAIGGGSAIGLAKAIALRTNLPQIAIPTTYSGSEVCLVHLFFYQDRLVALRQHPLWVKLRMAERQLRGHSTSFRKSSFTTSPLRSHSLLE